MCELTSYTWSALEEHGTTNTNIIFATEYETHVRLGIITTFEIIILYLISDVYYVHTAAETSPSPVHATVQHN